MSRIIVKNLPKYLTEQRLKEHFAPHGNVTDVKLMKKRNGELRQFAFIGYKSTQDAESAVKYFNKSFIDTARIEVFQAKTFSDPSVPKAVREKRRQMQLRLEEQELRLLRQKEEFEQKKRQKTGPKSQLDAEIEANPHLKEFIETLKPASQVQSWKNDSLADGTGAPSTKALEEALASKDQGGGLDSAALVARAPENASDDEYEDFGGRASGVELEEEMLSFTAEALQNEAGGADALQNEAGGAEAEPERDAEMSDLDWLKQRRVRIKENGEQVAETHEDTKNPVRQSEAKRRAEPPKPVDDGGETSVEAKIQATGRLFIRNILYESTEEEFRRLFSPYGAISEVHIAVDTRTGKSKGFVYVQFQNPEHALQAYRSLDKQIFQGRILHILAGDAKKDHRLDEFALKNLPLKKQRELKKKAQAGKTQFNWNSLYMNNDAVLESVASKLGVQKSQLVDPENSSSAVKQALAEAHVIGDVRKFFEAKGVDLTSFEGSERDDRVILVKNFPFGTTVQELTELFGEYGELKRVVMPPSGTIAIVEFRDLPAARAAFAKLAYRMFKKAILYLEKGPKNLFSREPTETEQVDKTDKEEDVVDGKISAKDVMDDEPEEEMLEKGPTVSVFIKNLNFSTTTESLREFFEELPGFVIAVVKTKPDAKNPGSLMSMGFGFAEFDTKEHAEMAIRQKDNAVLEGHRVQMKMSHRKGGKSDKGEKSKRSNKIIVKNLPFETSRKDVVELFGAYGQIKSLRVPKKFDKSARGFAFVEYTTVKEAESAMDQLQGVHLLGRRLVMQFAEKDTDDVEEEIEKMTAKAKKHAASRELANLRVQGMAKVQLEDTENPFDEF